MSPFWSRFMSAFAALALVLSLGACGDDGGGGPGNRAAMIEMMTDEMVAEDQLGIERDEARCIATAMVDEVGYEKIRTAMGDSDSFNDMDIDDEFDAELGMAMLQAMMDCMDTDDLFTPAD